MDKQKNITALALYHYQSCPFCAITRRAIEQSGLNIEQRDIQLQPQHRSALIKGGGKPQVPCLRIEQDDGQQLWLYESADIIDFLRNYAAQTTELA